MSDKSVMTAEEKRCLAVADKYVLEASNQINMKLDRVYSPIITEIAGSMLGELAADKYRDCMRQPPRTPPARPKAK